MADYSLYPLIRYWDLWMHCCGGFWKMWRTGDLGKSQPALMKCAALMAPGGRVAEQGVNAWSLLTLCWRDLSTNWQGAWACRCMVRPRRWSGSDVTACHSANLRSESTVSILPMWLIKKLDAAKASEWMPCVVAFIRLVTLAKGRQDSEDGSGHVAIKMTATVLPQQFRQHPTRNCHQGVKMFPRRQRIGSRREIATPPRNDSNSIMVSFAVSRLRSHTISGILRGQKGICLECLQSLPCAPPCAAANPARSIQVWFVKACMSNSTLVPFTLHYVRRWALLKTHHQQVPPRTGKEVRDIWPHFNSACFGVKRHHLPNKEEKRIESHLGICRF